MLLMRCFPVTLSILLWASQAYAVKPNVLIFYTDDQGYGDRGKYNPGILNMPELEALSANGLEFTDGHTGAAVCTPARFALLTGTYAFRQNPAGGAIEADDSPMIPGYYTLANLFKTAGYRTLMSGKWHLGMNMPDDLVNGVIEGGPTDSGFDEFFGIPASMNYGWLSYIRGNMFVEAPDVLTKKVKEGEGSIVSCPSGEEDCVTFGLEFPYSATSGDISVGPSYRAHYCLSNMTYEAIDMLERHVANYPSQPFFLYLSVTAPHLPHTPHPDFVGITSYGAYADYLEEIDYRLGQIMETLRQLGVYENTLLIFTSDNGTEEKDKYVETNLNSTWIYRGEKRDLWEGGHRVPFVMHWPDQIKANSTWAEPVSQVDFMATFAAMTNTTLPSGAGKDSFSLWAVLKDVDTASSMNVRENQPLVAEDDQGRLMVRCNTFKWLQVKRSKLYDLKQQPSEIKPYKGANRKKYKKLLRKAEKEIYRHGHSSKTAVCNKFLLSD
mmetsp:Transcript_21846/g.42971  ORF Transcript_21846/g.42971 Transcript_21846/m.42971 type:complete len:496 (-) Transcript_21846:184-1671(-)|eukprot:CAMPEP_0171486162 /NCGR_PEP_ID=MMETSP0958-20121227/940_1 /TAXON_ID=87120 /ORGANISM="Aurantiochytrium limacinum, Strain ATCCMYA-1381" /LENGTH=495 /DNA_ID=CAMNT_0012019017 /DNA_START=454 /DNA_END=1941 /DNA_ORIENTATION=+